MVHSDLDVFITGSSNTTVSRNNREIKCNLDYIFSKMNQSILDGNLFDVL